MLFKYFRTGTIFKDRHITVDISMARGSKKLYDEKRSVFIGNLPFRMYLELNALIHSTTLCLRI